MALETIDEEAEMTSQGTHVTHGLFLAVQSVEGKIHS